MTPLSVVLLLHLLFLSHTACAADVLRARRRKAPGQRMHAHSLTRVFCHFCPRRSPRAHAAPHGPADGARSLACHCAVRPPRRRRQLTPRITLLLLWPPRDGDGNCVAAQGGGVCAPVLRPRRARHGGPSRGRRGAQGAPPLRATPVGGHLRGGCAGAWRHDSAVAHLHATPRHTVAALMYVCSRRGAPARRRWRRWDAWRACRSACSRFAPRRSPCASASCSSSTAAGRRSGPRPCRTPIRSRARPMRAVHARAQQQQKSASHGSEGFARRRLTSA
jgi:hypothetical protein